MGAYTAGYNSVLEKRAARGEQLGRLLRWADGQHGIFTAPAEAVRGAADHMSINPGIFRTAAERIRAARLGGNVTGTPSQMGIRRETHSSWDPIHAKFLDSTRELAASRRLFNAKDKQMAQNSLAHSR